MRVTGKKRNRPGTRIDTDFSLRASNMWSCERLHWLQGVTISGGLVIVATVEVSLDFASIGVAEKGIHKPNK